MRRGPAVDAHRPGRVLRLDVAGLGLEDAVGGRQLGGPGRRGRLGPQDAAVADGRGDVDLLAVDRLVMLVGQEVGRDLGPPDGRPHDARPPQAARQPIPVHRVAAEDAGQRPERDAEGPQEQRALDVRDAGRHVGHEERGPDAVGGAVPQADAPDRRPPLGRRPVVLQLVPPVEAGREQLGGRSEALVEQPPERGRIVDGERVGVFRDGQADGTVRSRGPRHGPVGHDPPPSVHRGSWPFCQIMSAGGRAPQNP